MGHSEAAAGHARGLPTGMAAPRDPPLAADEHRLTEDERTMLALALAELDHRRVMSGSDEQL